MSLRIHPVATREIDDALQWSRLRFGPDNATRLRSRIERAGHLLLRDPGLGTPTAAGARKLPLGKFPYSLVYPIDGPIVHVLAFVHHRRLEDYWVARG